MPRKIDLQEPSDDPSPQSGDFAAQAADIFLKQARQTLDQAKLQTEIVEELAKRRKIEHEEKSWGIQRVARRGMLVLAGVLSLGAIGDAAVPDTQEYMKDASALELAVFHNETDPVELLGLVVPLFVGAGYTRKKKEDGEKDEG